MRFGRNLLCLAPDNNGGGGTGGDQNQNNQTNQQQQGQQQTQQQNNQNNQQQQQDNKPNASEVIANALKAAGLDPATYNITTKEESQKSLSEMVAAELAKAKEAEKQKAEKDKLITAGNFTEAMKLERQTVLTTFKNNMCQAAGVPVDYVMIADLVTNEDINVSIKTISERVNGFKTMIQEEAKKMAQAQQQQKEGGTWVNNQGVTFNPEEIKKLDYDGLNKLYQQYPTRIEEIRKIRFGIQG